MLKSIALPHIRVRDTFASLQYPNYRLWFGGQLVSLVGTWMQSAAQSYLMFELTQSPEYLGYVGFAAGLPSWFFTLYAGAVTDRVSRRMMLIVTQACMMVLALVLSALTFTGYVQPWHIIVLAFFLGIANSFDAPARQAFVLEMVDKPALTNAIALNSTMFTSAIVIGPAIGGLAYAAVGPAWCFLFNAVSFLAVILALALMRLNPTPSAPRKSNTREDILLGLKYVVSSPVTRMLILNLGVISLLGLGAVTLLPAWSADILGGDAKTYGLLLSSRGVGSLLGSLTIAALGYSGIRGKLWTIGSFIMPLVMIVFTVVRWIPLAMLSLVGMGWGFMLLVNTTNSLVQTQVPDDLRGRVMSVYILVFFGCMPIGSFIAGQCAAYLGEPLTLMVSAFLLLLFAGLVWWRMAELRKLE